MNASITPSITPLVTRPWDGYALLDSGHGRKLEKYGKVTVDRPEPQALWSPTLPQSEWDKAHARFTNTGDEDGDSGKWVLNKDCPESWEVNWEGVKFICRLMSFRHMGLFPEQLTHWNWVSNKIKSADRQLNILNLFAYTGAATLAAAKDGAQVTHLDASKKAIQWGKDNQAASGLTEAPIRWICDDAKAFVAREIRRGRKYDGIILDPPKFGRGPDGERWQIEEDLPDLLANCAALLSDTPSFMILTAYAMRLSSVSLAATLSDVLKDKGGKIDSGELLIEQVNGNRFLSTSLFARWELK
ncbi:MAG TPA: class I SAM-dependent methyltransferase [Alphaproteobacteria bacterium]|nr:class I SAM-dependent methyltransferase [Alphaproteobacteria bacterium]